MTRAFAFGLATALLVSGCVDATACHMATDWKPCAGVAAQPGAGGTPPSIVQLTLPTCAFLDSPTVAGMLHVTDPDSDAQVVDATFSAGPRINVSEVQLPDAGRAGTEWTGTLGLKSTAMSEGTYDVRIKITDLAGNQSQPYCGTLTMLR